MARRKLIVIGALPVDLINRTLGTELDPGDAILTARAHEHIARDHGDDYNVVMLHLELVITAPTYIGQSPHHGSEFEMVRRVISADGNEIILAAVNMTKNEFGNYNVHSSYRLTEDRVTKRVLSGHLKNPKRKAPF